ncbi:MAG: hypothetical protein IRZ28_10340 [Steroidobacteraceae bacterium]|nr:hypothetical protein [Steroidobacteraceae bacterium]
MTFENLMILQTGEGFTGHVIDYGWSDEEADAFMGAVRGCYLEGVSTAASLVNLNKAHSMLMDSSHFVGGDCALLGGGDDYANRINVQNCTFREQETAPIKDPGAASQAWLISGNTFEPAADNKARSDLFDPANHGCSLLRELVR